jgi:cell division protein FtsB
MKKILTDKRLIIVIVVIFLILLLLNFNQRIVLLHELKEQKQELQTELAQLENTREALKTQITYENSDDALEKWAREEAGMIQEGDIPIILVQATGQLPTPTPPPEVIVEEVQRWEIWQALFFDAP